jgi:ribosomal protein S18 acetylase RimI-like enzyme
VQIRRAAADDAAAIAAVHAQSWRDTYAGVMPDEFLSGPVEQERAELWRQRLSDQNTSWVVMLAVESMPQVPDSERLVGFVALSPAPDGDGVLLDNLHVAAGRQGRGVGAELLRLARETSRTLWPGRELFLWVLTANKGAARFYSREGGVPDGTQLSQFSAGFALDATRYTWREP